MIMDEQKKHLIQITNQQKELIKEIQYLDSEMSKKRELALKLQGVIEYLGQLGVSVEDEPASEEDLLSKN